MAESAKRHEKNSNIIKEIRASTDAAIRNQGASIKTLEIQIGQISKVLQERGIGGLSSSTKPNPRDYVKSISTAKANSSAIRRIGSGPYAEACEVKILETYDHTLPQKEKDPRRFTLPCFIHDICFAKALVDLGASVSVMPFSTYSNLGLGNLAHTRLTIELADRTIKHPMGIAKNMLVRIGKFIFPINFAILDIPEDDDVPLILRRPFLSTAHAKIDVFKRKFTLRPPPPAPRTIQQSSKLEEEVQELRWSIVGLGGNVAKMITNQSRFVAWMDAIRRILGFGIRRPCCKEIDDIVYSDKDVC
ncbi:ribonuclease H-like domain-containing protein [Tanacetum coccineum]